MFRKIDFRDPFKTNWCSLEDKSYRQWLYNIKRALSSEHTIRFSYSDIYIYDIVLSWGGSPQTYLPISQPPASLTRMDPSNIASNMLLDPQIYHRVRRIMMIHLHICEHVVSNMEIDAPICEHVASSAMKGVHIYNVASNIVIVSWIPYHVACNMVIK